MNHFYRRVTFGLIFCTMSFSLHAFSLFFQAPECVTYDPFEALIGMSEQQFFSKYGFSDAGKEFLRKKLQNKQGEFYVKGVEPFKADSSHKGFQDVSLEFPYTFSVVEGGENPTGKSFQKKVDVAALQALRANNGAVFQVASNLNCLESSGSKNEKISHYYGCRAQGQMSVLSALPGIIDRMYLQPSINLLAYFNWNGSIAYTSGKFPQVTDIDIRFKGQYYEQF